MLGALCVAKQGSLDCEKCNPNQKIARGCNAEPQGEDFVLEYENGKREPLKRCPRRLLADNCPEWPEFIHAWIFKNSSNILPVGGGLYDQSPTFMDGSQFFERELASYRKVDDV